MTPGKTFAGLAAREWAWLAGGYVAAILAGLAIAWLAALPGHWNEGAAWERATLEAVHGMHWPAVLDGYFYAVPWLGTNLTLAPIAVVLALWLAWKRRRDLALWIMVAELGCLTMNWLVKRLTARERPDLFERVGWYGWGSYPSGHALVGLAMLGTFAVILHREKGWTWPYWVVGVLVPSITYSRLHHAVHWPSDMIGGLVVGSVWLLVVTRVFSRVRRTATA